MELAIINGTYRDSSSKAASATGEIIFYITCFNIIYFYWFYNL